MPVPTPPHAVAAIGLPVLVVIALALGSSGSVMLAADSADGDRPGGKGAPIEEPMTRDHRPPDESPRDTGIWGRPSWDWPWPSCHCGCDGRPRCGVGATQNERPFGNRPPNGPGHGGNGHTNGGSRLPPP